jgi:3-oxoadipate enol-lactonase
MKIQANGIQINYELSGRENAPVVMLSHSLACSLAMWDPQMEALRAGYRVLRYDTRGHGGSEAPAGAYTLEQLGADALGLMDALDIDKVHWVGLSLGGMIGQCLALNHAGRLHLVTLSDTMAALPEGAPAIWGPRIETARSQGMTALAEPTLQRWFTPPYLEKNPPQVERIRELIVSTPVDGFTGCCEAILGLNYLNRLSAVGVPALIIVGKDDFGTPVAASEAMQAQIPGSQLVVLDDAAHLSNIEQAEAFDKALLPFLKSHR